MIKILILAANPKDTDPLRLGEEVREIKERLRLADLRDEFTVEQEWAVRVSDLEGYLLRHKPHVVHFSGHGSKAGQIILEDHAGNSMPVSPDALKRLFGILHENIRCVVLNACYSEIQAEGIVESIECVIGMSQAIPDKSAIAFASSFYQALGYGESIQTAFDLGCNRIGLEGLSKEDRKRDFDVEISSEESEYPKLKVAARVDAANVFLTGSRGTSTPIQTARSPFKLRLYSTPASVEAGEISLLAIAETIVATSFAVYLAIWQNTLFFLAITAIAAPSLLLRTEESQKLGLISLNYLLTRFYPPIVASSRNSSKIGDFTPTPREPDVTLARQFVLTIKALFMLVPAIAGLVWQVLMTLYLMVPFAARSILLVLMSLCAKTYAVLVSLYSNPIRSLRAIPTNWRRIALSVDFTCPPEIVPGIEALEVISEDPTNMIMVHNLKFSTMYALVKERFSRSTNIMIISTNLLLIVTFMLFYVPPFFYRCSLKSTSLLFFPLIWAVRKHLTTVDQIEDKIGDVLEDGMERLSRWYAWFVIIILTALPIGFLFSAYSARLKYSPSIDLFVSSTISPVLGYQILKIFLFVTLDRIEIGSWHVARLIGACITIWLYYYARKARRKVDKGIWQEPDVERRIGVAAFIRSCLGIFTAFCSVGIILTSVRWYDLPAIVIRWFPWLPAS